MVDPKEGVGLLWRLKENIEYRRYWEENGGEIERMYRHHRDPQGATPDFPNILDLELPFAVRGNPFTMGDGEFILTVEEALCFLDPKKSIDAIPADKRDYVLERLFRGPAIEVVRMNRWHPDTGRVLYEIQHGSRKQDVIQAEMTEEYLAAVPETDPVERECIQEIIRRDRERLKHGLIDAEGEYNERQGIRPTERVLLVDVSVKRKDLEGAFAAFLDSEKENLDPTHVGKRKTQHDVWHLRRHQGMEYAAIAKKLGIREDTVKDHFREAYLLTQGVPYKDREESAHELVGEEAPEEKRVTIPDNDSTGGYDAITEGAVFMEGQEMLNLPSSLPEHIPCPPVDPADPPRGPRRREAPLKLSAEETEKIKRWAREGGKGWVPNND